MNEKKDFFQKVWNSYFIRIFFCAMLCQLTMSVTNTILPLYVINGLGMTAAQSGLLGTAFTIGSLCCRVVAGYVSDRFGRRLTMVIGAAIITISMFMLGLQTTIGMLLIFKVTQGIGHSLHSTAANAAASEALPKAHVGQGIGYYAMHSMITEAFGPALALVMLGIGVAEAGQQNYKLALFFAGACGLVAVLTDATLNYEKKLKAYDPNYGHKPEGIHLSDFFEKRALLPAFMMLFTAFASGAACYMIVFATAYEFKTTSIYYVVFAVAGVAARFLIGNRLERVKPVKIAIGGVALNIIAYLALGLTLSEWSFLLSAVLIGAYEAILIPTFNAMAMKLAPQSRAGAAASTYWLGMDIGIAIGMVAFGAVIDAGGYKTAWLVSAAVMALFMLIAVICLRKMPAIVDMENPNE